MKIRITHLILLLLSLGNLSAKQIDRESAYRAASNFAAGYTHGSLRSLPPSLTLVYTATKADGATLRSEPLPLFYVYNIADNGGFVIVSAEDNAVPVLAYSEEGGFRPEALPDNLKNWLAGYEKEISLMIENGDMATEENRRKWDELLGGTPPAMSASVLLTTASWSQSDPYNKQCPMDGSKRSLAGCVATAMGIAMKYHEWPLTGNGSHSYVTREKKISLSVDFDVPYQWGLMPDINPHDWSDEEEDAVATLLYHAGVAVEMDYTATSSGAYTQDVVKALINHFGYDNSMYLAFKNLYDDDEWHALIREELNNDRPVIYAGVSANEGGHQFIINGYNSGNYYHVNWGWGGVSNGYFLLSSMDPDRHVGQSAGFSLDQDAVIGMQEAQSGSASNHEFFFIDKGQSQTTGLTTDVDAITRDILFRIAFSPVYDYGTRDFDGQMGFFLIDQEGRRKETLGIFSIFIKSGYAIYDDTGETYRISANIEEGDRIRMFYKPDGGKEWKPVRGEQGAVTELPVETETITSVHDLPAAQPVVRVTASAIHVRTTDQAVIRKLTLFDLYGRLVKERVFQPGSPEVSLPVQECPAGIYILSVETATGSKQYKIIR
ncbi:MAG: thiol protease/hemagglutinin PrtT [Tannerellaceae bacterium]|nr:thiol protease/hemagglutinin PrtT [Tannerellaceae bacterium]